MDFRRWYKVFGVGLEGCRPLPHHLLHFAAAAAACRSDLGMSDWAFFQPAMEVFYFGVVVETVDEMDYQMVEVG